MRATEALWLSDPNTELDSENLQMCTHINWVRNKNEIIAARKNNRAISKPRMATLFDTTDFEERAAILEFDGGMPRAEAEIQAKREIEERK